MLNLGSGLHFDFDIQTFRILIKTELWMASIKTWMVMEYSISLMTISTGMLPKREDSHCLTIRERLQRQWVVRPMEDSDDDGVLDAAIHSLILTSR